MFCPNCGANIPDGSTNCGYCGVYLVQEQAYVNQPTIPAGLTKKQYLASYATPKAKKVSLVTKIVTLLCVVLLVVSYFAVLDTSVEDIPIVSTLVGSDVEDFKELKRETLEYVEDLEDRLDKYGDDLTSEEKKACSTLISAMKKMSQSVSVNSIKNMANTIDSISKFDFDDADEIERFIEKNIGDTPDEVEMFINLCSVFALAFVLFPFIFTTLGGFKGSKGLVITGLVFLIFYGLTLCPLMLFISLIVVHVVLLILIGMINKEYKAYEAYCYGY